MTAENIDETLVPAVGSMAHSKRTHINVYCDRKYLFTYYATKYLRKLGQGEQDSQKEQLVGAFKNSIKRLNLLRAEKGTQ